MRAAAAFLILIGVIAGIAVKWPAQPGAALSGPAGPAARSATPVVTAGSPMASPSRPQPGIADDDGPTLIRNIERALASVDADERERVLANELPALIRIDAKSAGALVEHCEPGLIRDVLRTRVARVWAAADLNGAMDWVKTLDDAGERQLAAADVAAEVAASDPATALELFDLFGIGRADGSLEHVAQIWAEEHLQEALGYALAQAPSPARDQLLVRIVSVQAASDPAAAANLVALEIAPGAAQRDAALTVARQWAARDREAALQWVETLADSTSRKRVKAELARLPPG